MQAHLINKYKINQALKTEQLINWRQFCELVNNNPE